MDIATLIIKWRNPNKAQFNGNFIKIKGFNEIIAIDQNFKVFKFQGTKGFFKTNNVIINDNKIYSIKQLEIYIKKCKEVKCSKKESTENALPKSEVGNNNGNSEPGSLDKYQGRFCRASESGSICHAGSSASINSLRSIYSDIERRGLNQSEYIKDLVNLEIGRVQNDFDAKMLDYKTALEAIILENNLKNEAKLQEYRQEYDKKISELSKTILIQENLIKQSELNSKVELMSVKTELVDRIYNSSNFVVNSQQQIADANPSTSHGVVQYNQKRKSQKTEQKWVRFKINKTNSWKSFVAFNEHYYNCSFEEVLNDYASDYKKECAPIFEIYMERKLDKAQCMKLLFEALTGVPLKIPE